MDAIYTDTDYLLDVAPRLRERFPHLLSARPAALEAAHRADVLAAPDPEVALRDTRALLEGFWSHVVGEEDSAGRGAPRALRGDRRRAGRHRAGGSAAREREEVAG